MIIATGRIITQPERVHELLTDLTSGIARSREEDGCEFYTFALEDADLGHLVTLQIWRDEEALAAHLCTREIAEFVQKWTGHYEVETQLYDATGQRPVGNWHNPALAAQIAASQAKFASSGS